MITLQSISDKTAIGLSLLCAVHCLALPLLFSLLPSAIALQLKNEAFHYWMLFAVLPISIYALTLGCKQHKQTNLLIVGLLGLAIMLLAASLPEAILGEVGEKALTLIGAMLVAYGHFRNYRLCKHSESCECPGHKTPQTTARQHDGA